ncbi:MAG: extracellular solute-binding protein [Niabella sp.]
MAEILLKGITWDHSRGITPLQAAAQRFSEIHPGVRVQWDKRSLQQFADYPIEKLTESYDLLIIDHPWVGAAAATHCVLPLDDYLSAAYLKDQLLNSVGESHSCYHYAGHQWALAIDAAAPAASYRDDLLKANQVAVPKSWEDVLELAKAGRVAVPAIPIDLLMNFYTFCIAHGEAPFSSNEAVVSAATGVAALETMWKLYSSIDRQLFEKNPIAVAELMANTDAYWYCPFAYCYSNYSRSGYAANILIYNDVVDFSGVKLKTTIGGTGLSVSAFSKNKDYALKFAEMVCSPGCQVNGYTFNEGQPGYLKAWTSPLNNQLTHSFFNNLLPVMQRGYLRPRYHGYLHFQDEAGIPIQEYLSGKNGDALAVIHKINEHYRQSVAKKSIITTA